MKAALEGGFNDKDAWSRINFAGASKAIMGEVLTEHF